MTEQMPGELISEYTIQQHMPAVWCARIHDRCPAV
jgi:hypothetical protein